MSGDATDLDALAEARLDGEVDDTAWNAALAAHGEALASALARARALRGAIAGFDRPAMPDAVRAAIVAIGVAAPPAVDVAAAPIAEPSARMAPPLRFPWRTVVPAALAACLIVALLATLVLPWRSDGEPTVAKGDETRIGASSTPESPSSRLLAPAASPDELGDERDGGRARRGGLADDSPGIAKDAKRTDGSVGATLALKKADTSGKSADKAASLASTGDRQAVASADAPAKALDAARPTARAPGAGWIGAGAGSGDGRAATPLPPPAAAPTEGDEYLVLQESAPANAGQTTGPAAIDPAGGGVAMRERALEADQAKDEPVRRRANAPAANDAFGAAWGVAAPATVAAPAAPTAIAANPAAPVIADVVPSAAAQAQPGQAGAAAPAGAEADDELLADARRFVADKEKSPPEQALRKTAPDAAPGPLAIELVVADAAAVAMAGEAGAATRNAAPAADAKPAAKAEVAAKIDTTLRVFQLRVVNRTIGVAPLPGGMPTLHGFDAAGHEAWSATLHPTAQIVSADSEVRWQEPAAGALVPPAIVRTLRVQWGTLHSAAVPWTP